MIDIQIYLDGLCTAFPNIKEAIYAFEWIDTVDDFREAIENGIATIDDCIEIFRTSLNGVEILPENVLALVQEQTKHMEFRTYFAGKMGMM
jgi:hypothetical protein